MIYWDSCPRQGKDTSPMSAWRRGISPWGDLRFIEMTEEDIEEYGNDLLAAGFKLDEYGNYIMENVRLNGKTFDEFSGFFERYDTRDWIFYFSLRITDGVCVIVLKGLQAFLIQFTVAAQSLVMPTFSLLIPQSVL